MVKKFLFKFNQLLLVRADTRKVARMEEFHFNCALLLTNPSAETFRDGFETGKVLIDIRMHLKPEGAVRNHGTGFRVHEQDLPSLFSQIQDMLQ